MRDSSVVADCSPNGKINYILIDSQIADGSYNLDEKLKTHIQHLIEAYHIDDFQVLDEECMSQWEEFLDICVENGIKVYAFEPPMHDSVWPVISDDKFNEVYEEGIRYLDRTVTEAGGVFRDFSHVESFGGDPDGFYDSVHQRPSNLDKMIRELFVVPGPESEGESE